MNHIPFAAALIALTLLTGCSRPETEEVHVFAASSLTDVVEALADSFRTLPGGVPVKLNVAGSSLLARQIDHGARADLFVAAHPSWTDFLYERGRVALPVELPVTNRLVAIRRAGGNGRRNESAGRMALADPEHVPAGVYAREALECEGRWSELSDRLVPTLDVRAALAAVRSGAAEEAIVYASDVHPGDPIEIRPAVSERCQPHVRYTAAVVLDGDARDAAERFLALMRDAAARSLWRRHGFSIKESP